MMIKIFNPKMISHRFMLMTAVLVVLIVLLFAYLLNHITDMSENYAGVNALNAINQQVLETIIIEKEYLRSHDPDDLSQIVSSVQEGIRKTERLLQFDIFSKKDIAQVVGILKEYRKAILQLSQVIYKLNEQRENLAFEITAFDRDVTKLVGLVNEYEAESLIEVVRPSVHITTLRDVGMNASRTSLQIYANVNIRLLDEGDLKSYQDQHEELRKEYQVLKKNTEALKNYLTNQEYLDFIDKLLAMGVKLESINQNVVEYWKNREAFRVKLNTIRKDMLRNKEAILKNAYESIDIMRKQVVQIGFAAFFAIAALLISGSYLIWKTISSVLKKLVRGMENSANHVAATSANMAFAGRRLAEDSSRQASTIEEASSTLEEISSMTQKNSENAVLAEELTSQMGGVIHDAVNQVDEATASMNGIREACHSSSKIISTIDEIAFQTNLLALNAAVEAARAGEAGAGFGVVAQEVRNLAVKTAEAARNTANLLETTLKQVEQGTVSVSETENAFKKVVDDSAKVGQLISEIAKASREQAQDIRQITNAINDMDSVVQKNAVDSDTYARFSEQMKEQAQKLKSLVAELSEITQSTKQKGKPGEQIRVKHKNVSGKQLPSDMQMLPEKPNESS